MSLKILFMGTPDFAVPVLKSIHQSKHKILNVYTQPPKRKLRGQKVTSSPVHQCAEKLNIPVRCPENINTESEYQYIKNLNPNIVIVVAYGKMIPEKFLNLPDISFINIHASVLPRWRGAAPIQRALMNMDKETGISIMKIIKDLDAGPVMKTVKVNIKKSSNYENLSKELSFLSAHTIIDCLDTLKNKKEKFVPQDNSKATYAKKISKEEAQISWNNKAKHIIAKINALHPHPGCWFNLEGARVKVLEAKEINIQGKPGEIVDDLFTIASSENSVQILRLKKEGKRSMSASSFLIGNKLKIGKNLNEI